MDTRNGSVRGSGNDPPDPAQERSAANMTSHGSTPQMYSQQETSMSSTSGQLHAQADASGIESAPNQPLESEQKLPSIYDENNGAVLEDSGERTNFQGNPHDSRQIESEQSSDAPADSESRTEPYTGLSLPGAVKEH